MRIYISAVLKTEGFDAVPARNALEGIRKARELDPDLVIMDVMMPQAGGVTLFQDMRRDERLKATPIIMLTGVNQQAFTHHLNMLNACSASPLPPPDAYIEKPLDPGKLVQTIHRLLARGAPPSPP